MATVAQRVLPSKMLMAKRIWRTLERTFRIRQSVSSRYIKHDAQYALV